MEAQNTVINKPVVTKEWLANRVAQEPSKVIGRALAAIYKHQTATEQSTTSTLNKNGVGFCKPDARIGTIGARMFNAHGTLQPWVIEIWSKPVKDGYPRICRYASQLQKIAEIKKETLQKSFNCNINVITL